jgi:MerR family copper efflux transcriptional regulator
MTVGELARRTGLSIKAIRRYEALGLIYSAGRSEGNYRLFDESALWCADVIRQLRGLGMTIKEIHELATTAGRHRGEPVGPHLGARLDRVEDRIDAQLAELTATRRRIAEYRIKHAAVLSGHAESELTAQDSRRRGGA